MRCCKRCSSCDGVAGTASAGTVRADCRRRPRGRPGSTPSTAEGPAGDEPARRRCARAPPRLPSQRSGRSRCLERLAPHLALDHGEPAVEHRPAHRGRNGSLRRDRDARRLRGGADGPARSQHLGGPRRGPARHPGLRRELRVVIAFDLGTRLPGRGSRHDARRLSLGLSAGRGKLARCGSRPGGDRPQPRSELDVDVRPYHARSGAPGHPRWVPPRRARHPCRVRSVRDSRIPDLYDGDLHGIHRRPRHDCRLCPFSRSRRTQPPGPRRRGLVARGRKGQPERAGGPARSLPAGASGGRSCPYCSRTDCSSSLLSACRSDPRSTGSSKAEPTLSMACRSALQRFTPPATAPPPLSSRPPWLSRWPSWSSAIPATRT